MKKNSFALVLGLILFGFGPLPSLVAQTFTVLHNFTNSPDGSYPAGVCLSGGMVFGATTSGGGFANGFVFACGTNGAGLVALHDFTNSPDGSQPNEPVLNGGTLYGTTRAGGTSSLGTVFKVGTNGAGYAVIHLFTNTPDGYDPTAGLVADGNILYGTTKYGGGSGSGGIVFRTDTNGAGYTVLHTFTNTPDGMNPNACLVLNAGTLYGTTINGGLYTNGTIFKLATNGQNYSVIYNFSNAPDADFPYGKLVLAGNVLYGTSLLGGSSNKGAIFMLTTNGGNYAVLHNFNGSGVPSDGANPYAGMIFNNGLLYGDTSGYGSSGGGTIFQMGTNGTGFTVLKNLNNASDGGTPEAGLVWNANTLFGSANFSGSAGYGTLFSLSFSPTITAQPQSTTVQSGNAASFTVTATDVGTMKYQWYFNTNTLLANQTNSTLALASATNNNAGFYTVSVADNFGAVTSSPAQLTVTVSAVPPTISVQPQPQTVTNGFAASFSVTAAGSNPLAYQWYFNSNTGNASLLGTALGGQTATNLTFTSASSNGGYYSVVITNAGGAITSSPALLTVVIPIVPPSISVQPQPQTVNVGSAASFSVTAAGSNPLSYQWYFNSNTGNASLLGTALTGQTATNLTFTSASSNGGYYSVVITNSGGAVTSSAALLTVITYIAPPSITAQPQSVSVTNGFAATFSVTAGGPNPLYYQWYFNTNTLLPGQTNSTLTFFTATNNAGYYSVIVTNAGGATNSSLALLTVIVATTAPIITAPPPPLSVISGGIANLAVTASGRSPLRYQWYFNANSVLTNLLGNVLAGETNATLTFTDGTSNQGYYSVVVTNRLGAVTSTPPALLTVITNPIITGQPQSLTVTNGNSATFTAAAIGAGVLNYQWYFNTNTLVAGATNTTLNFASASNSLTGTYLMIVTNIYGRATSSVATLTVVVLAAPAGQPKILNYSLNPASGSFALTLTNNANSTNRLWAATNLSAANFWSVIATNVMAANGLWFFTDTNIAKTNKVRFYRLSTP